jgi:dTDP-4-amino-4,6-dideoxygalactose transaminase
MKYVNYIVDRHIANGKYYDEALKKANGVELVTYNRNTQPSYWLYTLKIERRDDFIKMMTANGVTVSPLHHRNDTHAIFKDSKRDLPNMDVFYDSFIHIPCGWWVADEDRERIVELIKKGW